MTTRPDVNHDNRESLLKIAQRPDLSPLRYPGGKRKLVPLIADVFSQARTPIRLLVEPFAGGAAVSLALLEAEMAERVILADKDELVASFWKTVFSKNAPKLADMILCAPVTLAEWDRLRASQPTNNLERAYKCLFLNRTSFSGILHSKVGVVGGRKQAGKYTIGCRFNQPRLAERILKLSDLRSRVQVRHQDYLKTVVEVTALAEVKARPKSVYWYFDPPFFNKAEWLYRHAFDENAHRQFRQTLFGPLPGHWVLSYDDTPQARAYYARHPGYSRINLSYNARIDAGDRLVSSEIIVSNIIARLRADRRDLHHMPERPMLVADILNLLSVTKRNSATSAPVGYK
jgi:DNA adenine methylase